MKKITIISNIKEQFKNLVFSVFKKDRNGNLFFEKRKDGKILFSITLRELNELVNKKLKNFDNNINFEKLMTAEFDYLKNLTEYIDKNKEFTKLTEKEKEYFYTLYERLKKSEFIKLLNVTTCLYCNRNYVFNFKKGKKLKTTAQLDHFYNKKDYLYLAVSLYNLVPCCSTCNLRKSSQKVDIFHPYVDSFDDYAKFTVTITNSDFYYSLDGFEIDLEPKQDFLLNRVRTHIEIFELKDLYKKHKDIVLELIKKKYMYQESYLDELLKKYEGTLFKNREDLLRLVSGGYINEDEINKRPLSKLIKDISEDLEIF